MEPWLEATIITLMTVLVVAAFLFCFCCRIAKKERTMEEGFSQSGYSKTVGRSYLLTLFIRFFFFSFVCMLFFGNVVYNLVRQSKAYFDLDRDKFPPESLGAFYQNKYRFVIHQSTLKTGGYFRYQWRTQKRFRLNYKLLMIEQYKNNFV